MMELTPDEKAELRKAAEASDTGLLSWWTVSTLVEPIQDGICRADARFIARANPSTVLALLDENARLTEEVARLKAERQWIPVGERMPDFGDDVLILHEDSVEIAMLTHKGNRRPHEWVFCQTNEAAYGVVTHWMPLPEPPK